MKVSGCVGWLMACVLGACGHAPHVAAPEASPVANFESPTPAPEMDGTCTVTTAEAVCAYTYDASLLVRSTTSVPLMVTVYAYDGVQLISVETAQDGDVVSRRELRYDASGHLEVLIKVVQGRERELRRFEYDAAGRLSRTVEMTDEGVPWIACTLRYDDLERVTSYTCALPGYVVRNPQITTYRYDSEGRLIEYRDGGWIVQTHYDAAGRWERIDDSAPESGVQSTTTVVRDERGRERELRIDMGELGSAVDEVRFNGTFGADADCRGVPSPPPGIPAHRTIRWLDDTNPFAGTVARPS